MMSQTRIWSKHRTKGTNKTKYSSPAGITRDWRCPTLIVIHNVMWSYLHIHSLRRISLIILCAEMPLFHSEVYATANERLWKMGNLRRKMTLTSGGFFTPGPVISSPWWRTGGTRYLHADWTRNSGASRRGWQFDSWLRSLEPWELLSSEAVSASGKCLKSFKGRLFFSLHYGDNEKNNQPCLNRQFALIG